MQNLENEIRKPQNDLKEYRFIELPNKVQAILVSTKKYIEHFKVETNKKKQSNQNLNEEGNANEEDREEDYEDVDDEEEDTSMDEENDEEDDEDEDDEEEEDEEDDKGKGKKKKIGLATCSVVINAGSLYDPSDIQGLAHLLEHVIFLGSKEYPAPDEYSKFMSRHGGYDNAYTSLDSTTYEFDIDNEFLEEALYRLSRLLKEPILGSEGIQKEVQAVNNEFDLATADEDVQRFQVIADSYKKGFPLNAFTWGNSKSLGKPESELQQGVRAFFENYYHPDKMKLCVQANHSLDELERIVRKAFEDIETKQGFKSPISVVPEDIQEAKANFASFNFLKTSSQIIKLTFTWLLDSLEGEHENYPLDLILELINERSEGSLYYILKQKQLITDFAAEVNTIDGQENVYVSMPWLMLKLTDLGLKNLSQIIEYVGEYINMLRKTPIPDYYLKEWIVTNQLEFKYADEMSEDQLANQLAHSLKRIPIERILEAGVYRVPQAFNEKLYYSVLEDFDILKARIDIQTPDINEDLKALKKNQGDLYENEEKYFAVKWTSLDLNMLLGRELVDKLAAGKYQESVYGYPKKNPLIPENVELKVIDDNYKVSKKIEGDNSNIELWHSFDSNYKMPKACVNLIIFYRLKKSAEINCYMELLEMYLKEEFVKAIGSDAIKAGYDCSISKYEFCALELNIYGFSDKIVILTEKILAFIQDSFGNIEEDKFELLREKKVKYYESMIDDPETYAKRVSLKIYFDFSLMPEERKEFYGKCKYSDFKEFCLELLHSSSISNSKIQIHGNVSIEESKNIKETIVKNLKSKLNEEKSIKYLLPPDNKPVGGIRKIIKHKEFPTARLKCHLKDHKTNLVLFSIELDEESIRSRLYNQVLNQIFNSEIFEDLRVKQDIGYISNSYTNNFPSLSIGLEIWVSSSKLSSKEITEKIMIFIEKFVDEFLEKMTEEEFAVTVQSELSIKQKPFHNIQETGDYYWFEIKNGLNEIQRKEEEIKILKELKYAEFKKWVLDCFYQQKFFIVEIDIKESADDPNPFVNVEKVNQVISKFPDIKDYFIQ